MSPSISLAGRFQFSSENEYSVRAFMPRRPHSITMSRTVRAPARCPAIRGMRRSSAQRPLPSMMMAMCCGRRSGGISSSVRLGIGWMDVGVMDQRIVHPSRAAGSCPPGLPWARNERLRSHAYKCLCAFGPDADDFDREVQQFFNALEIALRILRQIGAFRGFIDLLLPPRESLLD